MEKLESRELLTATLIVSEVNYNPYDPIPAFGDIPDSSAGDYEFIEVLNYGDEPIELNGIKFIQENIAGTNEGVAFVFNGDGSLDPDERIVVVENLPAFEARYGTEIRVAGRWAGGLSNKGEQIKLVDKDNSTIVQFTYDNGGGWPGRADGEGASLTLDEANLNLNESVDLNDPDSWNSSIKYGGTPGSGPLDRSQSILINEVLAHTDPPEEDAIELYNSTTEEMDVSGWYLSDRIDKPFVFQIADGTEIPANGYTVIFESEFFTGQNPDTDFALSETGDELWLISATEDNRPDRFIDRVSFDETSNGVSVGNFPNGVTRGDFVPLADPTLGGENVAHRVGEFVITEVQYHPADDDVFKEFIELTTTRAIPPQANPWRISNAVDIDFEINDAIALGEVFVLVAFDPILEEDRASTFRNYYGIDETVNLVGPWDKDNDQIPDTLSDGGEKVTFRKAEPDAEEVVLYVPIDQVDYNDKEPWPITADGHGASIERTSTQDFGNEPTNWLSATPTPGNQPIQLDQSPVLSEETEVSGDIGNDGDFNRGASDVDIFRFSPSATTNYQFDAKAFGDNGVDTFLRVFDVDGNELAHNGDVADDNTDSQIVIELNDGEQYYVSVSAENANSRDYNIVTGVGLSIDNPDLPNMGPYSLSVESVTIVNPFPWQNPSDPLDVNNDGDIAPNDILAQVNALNGVGPVELGPGGALPAVSEDNPPPFLDVSGDGFVAPNDILEIVNFLNQRAAAVAAVPVMTTEPMVVSDDVRASLVDSAFAQLDTDKDKLDRLFPVTEKHRTEARLNFANMKSLFA